MEEEGKRKTAKERRMTSGTGAEPDRRNRKAEEKRDFLERERERELLSKLSIV
ncbi:hypothetical protein Bca4012_083389 [Brassica carinata]